ncbi:MAG: hypothetical protein JWL65_963 [Gammaproteobacteria bacterium]|nr:hypothetical protein [Gammaproteobacteria bacterium]
MPKNIFEGGPHNILLGVGLIGCLIFCYGVFGVLCSELDVRVVEKKTMCEQPLNNRCRYQYLVEHDGQHQIISVSGYVFDSGDLVVGSSVKKGRFSFEYQVNGYTKFWPFAADYIGILLFSFLALGLWLVPRIRLIINSAFR